MPYQCLLKDNHPYVYGQAYTKDWKPYPTEIVSTSTGKKGSSKDLKPYSSEATSSSSTQDKEKALAEIYGPKYYLVPKNKLNLFQECQCKECYWKKNAKQIHIKLGLQRLKKLEREIWRKQREMEIERTSVSVADLKKKYGLTSKFSFKTYLDNKRKLMKKEMCETNKDKIEESKKK